MRVAFDTNILAYASGVGPSESDATKALRADLLIEDARAAGASQFVAAQTLLELFEVLTRKARWTAAEAGREVDKWATGLEVVATDRALLAEAQNVAVQHRLRIFDAAILAAAASVQCDVLYSEDMHHGFSWQGVTILNPFRE